MIFLLCTFISHNPSRLGCHPSFSGYEHNLRDSMMGSSASLMYVKEVFLGSSRKYLDASKDASHIEGILSSMDMIVCPAAVNSFSADFIVRSIGGCNGLWASSKIMPNLSLRFGGCTLLHGMAIVPSSRCHGSESITTLMNNSISLTLCPSGPIQASI